MRFLKIVPALVCFVVVACSASVHAQSLGTPYWRGVTGDWSNASNWTIAGPTSNGSRDLGFRPSDVVISGTYTANNNLSGFTATGITFDNVDDGPTGFHLSGNQITLGGNIVTLGNSGTPTHTISLAMSLNGNRTITTEANNNLIVSGAISEAGGSRSLTKEGGGTLTLSGANSFTGGVVVNGGSLQVGNGGTTGSLGSGNVTVNTALTFNRSNTATFSNSIAGSGTVSTTGTGTIALTGNNTYSGLTTVSSGALNIQNANALGSTSGGTIVNSGAALQIQGGITTAAESLTLNGSGVSNNGALRNISGDNTYSGAITLGSAASVHSSSGTLTLDVATGNAISGSGQNVTFTGTGNITVSDSISLGTGTLSKLNGGTLTLSSANSYSGGTFWGSSGGSDGGTLSIGHDQAFGTGTLNIQNDNNGLIRSSDGTARSINNNITIAGTGIQFNTGGTGDLTFNGTVNLTGGGRTFNVANAQTTFTGVISGTSGNSLTKGGTGTMILTGANTYNGTTTVSAGTLQLGNGGTNGSLSTSSAIVLNGGTFSVNQSDTVTQGTDFSGAAISGAGGFTQAGTGTTILTSANTYTGNTTVSNGTLQLGNGGTGGSLSTSSAISIASGATFRVNQSDTVIQGADFSGAAITGAGGFTQAGTGTTILTAANTYTGNTSVTNGTLELGNGGTGGSLSTSSAISVASGATFSVNQSDTVTQGVDFSGSSITGQGGFAQNGSGTTILTANNTYTGATTVNAGTLRINGNQIAATGNVTVLSGATLGGSGTIGGATTISGIHSPGNSPGLQTFNGGLTYLNGSSLTWELVDNTVGGRGALFDAIDVTGGTLTINSGVTSNLVFNGLGSLVDWNNVFWGISRQWLVYDNANPPAVGSPIFTTINVSNDMNNASLGSIRDGSFFSWIQDGSDIFLRYNFASAAAVPEPGTFGLMGLAGLIGVLRHRRRRKEMSQV